MTFSEEMQWQNIQQRDLPAFESYYKDHYKELFIASYKYVKESALAEEIVNDVFLKIWEDAEKINIETSLKAYLYRAIINRSINALNKQKRESLQQKELAGLQEDRYDVKEMEVNELKVRLYKAIDELPEQCRKVFMMSRFEGRKQQEIADHLGISIKTVKNHITHALKELSKVTGLPALTIYMLLLEFFSSR